MWDWEQLTGVAWCHWKRGQHINKLLMSGIFFINLKSKRMYAKNNTNIEIYLINFVCLLFNIMSRSYLILSQGRRRWLCSIYREFVMISKRLWQPTDHSKNVTSYHETTNPMPYKEWFCNTKLALARNSPIWKHFSFCSRILYGFFSLKAICRRFFWRNPNHLFKKIFKVRYHFKSKQFKIKGNQLTQIFKRPNKYKHPRM